MKRIVFILILLASAACAGPERASARADLPGCSALPDRLAACAPFACRDTVLSIPVTAEIRGMEAGACTYIENGASPMTCSFAEDARVLHAERWRDALEGRIRVRTPPITIDAVTGEVESPPDPVMRDCRFRD